MKDTTKKTLKKCLFALIAILGFFAIVEIALRLTGRPHGDFEELFLEETYRYPESMTIDMTWGPIPYQVVTNLLGLRGGEIEREKPTDTYRILAIGDSITDGFFVENEATWQAYLEPILDDAFEHDIEVINGARGAASIPTELRVLRRSLPILHPDMVVLTIVTNDFDDLREKPLEELLADDLEERNRSLTRRLSRFWVGQTAFGEFMFHLYLSGRSSAYRSRPDAEAIYSDARYEIAGGDDFSANLRLFEHRMSQADLAILQPTFNPQMEQAFTNYVAVLAEFTKVCRENDVELVVLFFPAYSQIYTENPPTHLNERLKEANEKLGNNYLDLTPGFREAGKDRVLHLAPTDFHPNPAGNKVFAELLGEYLIELLKSKKLDQEKNEQPPAI